MHFKAEKHRERGDGGKGDETYVCPDLKDKPRAGWLNEAKDAQATLHEAAPPGASTPRSSFFFSFRPGILTTPGNRKRKVANALCLHNHPSGPLSSKLECPIRKPRQGVVEVFCFSSLKSY